MSWNIHSFNFSYRDANVTKNGMDEKKNCVYVKWCTMNYSFFCICKLLLNIYYPKYVAFVESKQFSGHQH